MGTFKLSTTVTQVTVTTVRLAQEKKAIEV